MATLFERFERDLLYLAQNQVPLEAGGEPLDKLKYESKKGQQLTDPHVERLCKALARNSVFCGPLDLEDNDLTDLSALYLAEVLRKPQANITKLNLSDCKAFSSKAGEYICQALLDTPSARLEKLEFKGVHLESRGLLRAIDAANKTESLEKLDVGVLTDEGLKLLAERLYGNQHLSELCFSETADHQKYWSSEACKMFIELLKTSTKLKSVKCRFQECNRASEQAREFREELDFYTAQKQSQKKKAKAFKERMHSCD